MEALLPFFLLCFTSFFTLTNPLGTMPVFLTMTNGMTDKERQAIVRRATIVSFITLMVFVFAGQFLFKFFGISTNGFRIAGGVIIFKIGFDMLQARYTPMKLKDEEIKTTLQEVYDALQEKGYNPINQIIGYILSEDPTYITTHRDARKKIRKLDRDDILQSLLRNYLK